MKGPGCFLCGSLFSRLCLQQTMMKPERVACFLFATHGGFPSLRVPGLHCSLSHVQAPVRALWLVPVDRGPRGADTNPKLMLSAVP